MKGMLRESGCGQVGVKRCLAWMGIWMKQGAEVWFEGCWEGGGKCVRLEQGLALVQTILRMGNSAEVP